MLEDVKKRKEGYYKIAIISFYAPIILVVFTILYSIFYFKTPFIGIIPPFKTFGVLTMGFVILCFLLSLFSLNKCIFHSEKGGLLISLIGLVITVLFFFVYFILPKMFLKPLV